MKISFVIPCYKSAKTIPSVINEIEQTIQEKMKCDYEIILVNDASPDNTFEVIREIAQKNKHIIAINLAKNSGQACASMCGFRYATGDYIVSGDDDGQTPFDRIGDLKDKLDQENFDVVCGKYVDRDQKKAMRNLGSKANIKMSEVILDQPKDLYMSVFFIAKKFVIDEIVKYENPYPYITGLLLRTTKNIGNVEVKQRERVSGHSGYTIRKLLKLWLNGFTTFSIKPLRVATVLGCIIAFSGFIYGGVVIVNKIMNPENYLAGYSSLIAVVLFTSGVILMVLGMIGEYIGRIYISINNAPQYVIKEVINADKK